MDLDLLNVRKCPPKKKESITKVFQFYIINTYIHTWIIILFSGTS